jgi:hypothetical protein
MDWIEDPDKPDNLALWYDDTSRLSAEDRRILIHNWYSRAALAIQDKLHRTGKSLKQHYFEVSGAGLTCDGVRETVCPNVVLHSACDGAPDFPLPNRPSTRRLDLKATTKRCWRT